MTTIRRRAGERMVEALERAYLDEIDVYEDTVAGMIVRELGLDDEHDELAVDLARELMTEAQRRAALAREEAEEARKADVQAWGRDRGC